jgi:hypothetical protein
MVRENPDRAIELRLRDVSQLFNTLDPFPFRERDLAPEAENYIVDWAQDLPKDQPIHIVIHLPPQGTGQTSASDIAPAIAVWFADREKAESRAIRQLFRDGRLAFLIGVAVLSGCMLLAWHLTQRFADAPFARIVQESFVIIGWVVIWRPVEMFLYDWLPLVRRRKLFRRLAASVVTVQHDAPPATSLASS